MLMKRVSALIVDTDEMVLFLFKDFIESREPNFDRFFVDNVGKAKFLIEVKNFDILAINYRLANSNNETGVSIAARLRSKNPQAPIIILTGLVEEAEEEAREMGILNRILFIRKPVTFSELSAQIESFLGVAPW